MNCGRCRDWYFTGDRETWNWVRNYENWEDADWKRYHDDPIYEHFKRRDGSSCHYVVGYGGFFYGDDGVYGDYHCMCENNVCA